MWRRTYTQKWHSNKLKNITPENENCFFFDKWMQRKKGETCLRRKKKEMKSLISLFTYSCLGLWIITCWTGFYLFYFTVILRLIFFIISRCSSSVAITASTTSTTTTPWKILFNSNSNSNNQTNHDQDILDLHSHHNKLHNNKVSYHMDHNIIN